MNAGPTMASTMAIKALAAAALISASAVSAQAVDPYMGRNEWNPTDAEVAQLPPYCQGRELEKWQIYSGSPHMR